MDVLESVAFQVACRSRDDPDCPLLAAGILVLSLAALTLTASVDLVAQNGLEAARGALDGSATDRGGRRCRSFCGLRDNVAEQSRRGSVVHRESASGASG